MMEASDMKDHNGVLMMQRALLAGTLGLTMARNAAATLEGEPNREASLRPAPDGAEPHDPQNAQGPQDAQAPQNAQNPHGPQNAANFREPQGTEGAVLRAILDAANECLGHFDDRPAGGRGGVTLFPLLDPPALAPALR